MIVEAWRNKSVLKNRLGPNLYNPSRRVYYLGKDKRYTYFLDSWGASQYFELNKANGESFLRGGYVQSELPQEVYITYVELKLRGEIE